MKSCPNCGISCVGCAGAKLTNASDGKVCCTKCVGIYDMKLRQLAASKIIPGNS